MGVPLNIDWQQILLHLFNFLILFGGLYLLLYRPVKAFMDKRTAYYADMDAEAKRKLADAERQEKQYRDHLANVENEADALKKQATIICVDFMNERIKIQNRTPDVLHRAFDVIEAPTWEDFNYFLKERCFPATRGNVKQLLRQMQIGGYDPLQIAEKTAGRMAEDNLWLKFDYYKGAAKRGTNIVVRQ